MQIAIADPRTAPGLPAAAPGGPASRTAMAFAYPFTWAAGASRAALGTSTCSTWPSPATSGAGGGAHETSSAALSTRRTPAALDRGLDVEFGAPSTSGDGRARASPGPRPGGPAAPRTSSGRAPVESGVLPRTTTPAAGAPWAPNGVQEVFPGRSCTPMRGREGASAVPIEAPRLPQGARWVATAALDGHQETPAASSRAFEGLPGTPWPTTPALEEISAAARAVTPATAAVHAPPGSTPGSTAPGSSGAREPVRRPERDDDGLSGTTGMPWATTASPSGGPGTPGATPSAERAPGERSCRPGPRRGRPAPPFERGGVRRPVAQTSRRPDRQVGGANLAGYPIKPPRGPRGRRGGLARRPRPGGPRGRRRHRLGLGRGGQGRWRQRRCRRLGRGARGGRASCRRGELDREQPRLDEGGGAHGGLWLATRPARLL